MGVKSKYKTASVPREWHYGGEPHDLMGGNLILSFNYYVFSIPGPKTADDFDDITTTVKQHMYNNNK